MDSSHSKVFQRFSRMDWHCCAALSLLFALVLAARSQARKITTPREALGFNIGDDYQIATYSQAR